MNRENWQDILNIWTASQRNELLNLNLGDKDLDRIVAFCFENKNLNCREIIENYLKSFKATRKDDALALQLKDDGNRKFLANNYEKSLHLYTKSIIHADENSTTLPLSYANRSLVLEKLGYLSESGRDIDLALACGYPKTNIEKLKTRKKKLLEQLKNKQEVSQKSNKVAPKEIRDIYLESDYKLPAVVGGGNKKFASASANLSICFDEKRGRHVIATKNIKIGEVLFVEKPFAFVVFGEACFNCMQKTMAPIPCKKCLDVSYCSLKCRDDSWESAHFLQCGFGKLFNSVGVAYLGLQTVIAASTSLCDLKNKIENISEPKYANGIVPFWGNGYDSVYNLVYHFGKQEATDLFQYTMTALLLSTYMKKHTNYFLDTSGEEDLKFLTSVILRHILQMICNGQAIMEASVRGGETSGVLIKKENRVGTAIYPSASMMNHSCLPCVFMSFYKSYMIVQAAKEIKKGEEVFNCYAADARRMKRSLRQKILREQYFFQCQCEACIETFDILDKFTAFKCIYCEGPLIQINENVLKAICTDCNRNSQISNELVMKNSQFYKALKEGELFLLQNVKLSLKKFLSAWTIGREIFYKYHQDLSYAADRAAKCFAILEDFKKCISFLKPNILTVEKRFGTYSLELVEELNKLLDVQLAHIARLDSIDRDFEKELIMTQEKCLKIMNVMDGNSEMSAPSFKKMFH